MLLRKGLSQSLRRRPQLKINVRSTWDQKLGFIFAPLLMQMLVGTRNLLKLVCRRQESRLAPEDKTLTVAIGRRTGTWMTS